MKEIGGILKTTGFIVWTDVTDAPLIGAPYRSDEPLQAERSTLDKLNAHKVGLIDNFLTGHIRVTPLLAEMK